MGRQGLKTSDRAACYDGGNGAMAARLWWLLRWVGHKSVAVLDGGFAKWIKEARPVSRDIPLFATTQYPLRLRNDAALGVADVEKDLGNLVLLDARAPARFRGEQEPIDPEAGRIPGARNRFNLDNVTQDATFKPPAQLRKEFEAVLGNSEPVHYCGSGVAACHNLLAMEVAGLPGAKLFAGSWSEWIADPARPREKG